MAPSLSEVACLVLCVLCRALNLLFNIFNGFTIVRSAIPSGWQWANRAVPPTWMIYGL
jgi:hypothetical protein